MPRDRHRTRPSSRRSDPSALRFLIASDLRTFRERAGLTQSEAAQILNCTQGKINHVETGRTGAKPKEVATLLRAYGASPEHADRMASLAASVDQKAWWVPYSEVLPGWFQTFVGLEGLAIGEFAYVSRVLPGQLQTPDYAAALLVNHAGIAPMDAPLIVRARMDRQRLTDSAQSLRFGAVIEQVVIERKVGGDAVMRRQLEQVLRMMERDNVEVQVMPTAVAVHDGLDGDFLLLDFGNAQSIGYFQEPGGAVFLQDSDRVTRYVEAAGRLREAALSSTETVEFIQARIAGLDE